MDPDDVRPEYQGWWIYIDPDEHLVKLVDLDLDLNRIRTEAEPNPNRIRIESEPDGNPNRS